MRVIEIEQLRNKLDKKLNSKQLKEATPYSAFVEIASYDRPYKIWVRFDALQAVKAVEFEITVDDNDETLKMYDQETMVDYLAFCSIMAMCKIIEMSQKDPCTCGHVEVKLTEYNGCYANQIYKTAKLIAVSCGITGL